MNKKLNQLTKTLPAALLSLPALCFAQSSSVEIYGRIHAGIDSVSVSATPSLPGGESALRVVNNSSKMGFRGHEDLGGGMRAFFQIEGTVGLDDGTGGINNKDTFIGLGSDAYGKIKLGRFSTAMKDINGYTNRFLGEGIQDDANISQLGGEGSPNGFNRRSNNSISYQTPKFGDFVATIYHAAEVEGPGGNHIWSSTARYASGALTGAVGYELHQDLRPGFKDKMVRLLMNYKFGTSDIGVGYNRLMYDVAAGSLQRDYFTVTGSYGIGSGALIGRFGIAGNVKGSAPNGTSLASSGTSLVKGPDSGAKQITLGYAYDLSKRTQLYAYYTRTKNDANANYTFGSNPFSTLKKGATISGALLGIVHYF